MHGTIGATLQGWGFKLEQTTGKLRSDHRDINERIDTLARAVEAAPAAQGDANPFVAPLLATRKEKRTAAILANYELALRALGAPGDPASLAAAKGQRPNRPPPTLCRLFALYTVLGQQPGTQCRCVVDLGLIFEANFRSEQDRVWKLYTVRALGLKVSSGTLAARNVMELGLAYFGKPEDAWPDVIRFYGETQRWDEAKRRAVECGKFFRQVAARCNGAAICPSEQAKADRKAQAKAINLVDKVFKNKSRQVQALASRSCNRYRGECRVLLRAPLCLPKAAKRQKAHCS